MDFHQIYAHHADEYDRLIRAEDCDGSLGPALEAVRPLAGARVLDVGAGTGRLALLAQAGGATVLATDRAPAMLEVARRRLGVADPTGARWSTAVADYRALPASSGWADLVVAGWALGHQRGWDPEGWRESLRAAVGEMRRCAAPGGHLVVFETLGTGAESPTPPPGLDEVHDFFEHELGFEGQVLRTDYQFASVDEAVEVCGFFFGPEMAARIRDEDWSRVPECTGMWVGAAR